jgi:hypothetical protein
MLSLFILRFFKLFRATTKPLQRSGDAKKAACPMYPLCACPRNQPLQWREDNQVHEFLWVRRLRGAALSVSPASHSAVRLRPVMFDLDAGMPLMISAL